MLYFIAVLCSYVCHEILLCNNEYNKYSSKYVTQHMRKPGLYVTRHEKTRLMYTKYTPSYYGTYLLYYLTY